MPTLNVEFFEIGQLVRPIPPFAGSIAAHRSNVEVACRYDWPASIALPHTARHCGHNKKRHALNQH
jgi:hypothetical protein